MNALDNRLRLYGSGRGRPPEATLEQEEEVYRLADEGLSQRAIAERVFGDRRLKNRAMRLIRQRAKALEHQAVMQQFVDETLEEAIAAVEALYPPPSGADRPQT